MKNLIIITYDALYGNWIIDELKYHKKRDYDNFLVFSTKKDASSNIEKEGVYFFDLQYKKVSLLVQALRTLFMPEFIREEKEICRSKHLNKLQCIMQALVYMATAKAYAKEIEKKLTQMGICYDDSNVFYAYWMSVQVETFFTLRKKYRNSAFVSRAHSIDVYEERTTNKYLEYRKSLAEILDAIYFISEDAKKHFENLYACSEKCKVQRMGSANEKVFDVEVPIGRKPLKIVSCSSIIEVKRLHLLVKALRESTDYPIIWHHYGIGHLEKEIKKIADELPKNIEYELKGFVNHSEILEMYLQEKYNLFINTSEIEGIPVSMMEALSVGIPVLGPDVGGIPEIVKDGITGYCYNKEQTVQEIRHFLEFFINMDENQYQLMRETSYEFWNSNYNMDKNYGEFSVEMYMLI